jgi:hypothetical protein
MLVSHVRRNRALGERDSTLIRGDLAQDQIEGAQRLMPNQLSHLFTEATAVQPTTRYKRILMI